MKVTDLRDFLLELLEDELGTQEIANDTSPAITIRDNSFPIDAKRKVNGLEVVILRVADQTSRPLLSSGTQRDRTWQLYLIQREGEHTLQAALDKLNQEFVGVRAVRVSSDLSKGIREQFSVRIPDLTEFVESL